MNHSKMLIFFYLVFFFISLAAASSHSSNGIHRCPVIQSQALFMFKQNLFSTNHSYDETNYHYELCYDWLGSEYHPIMTNWNMSIDCCDWHGVKCNHFTGDVIGLDLSCGKLQGTINPNTTLFHLPHLQRLNLAFNDFSNSHLPLGIVRLSNSLTHLNISGCGFKGQVPTSITHFHRLVSLDLFWNSFEGKIQPHVFYHLLQNSTYLRELSLSGVNISSNVATFVNISSSLKSLKLANTNLHGKLPDSMFRYLEKLDLSGNNDLTSQWPNVNGNTILPLKWLDLSSTKGLSGEIPDSIGHLKYLNTLCLSYCSLMGPLPKSLGHLTHLTTLFLVGNMLNGTLPSWLFTLPSLENLDLRENMFRGSLPLKMFNHKSLQSLYLSYNQFDGKIDVLDQDPTSQSFMQLTNLIALDLSFNNFKGVWKLDTLLSGLTALVYLDLSYSGLSVTTDNVTRYVNPEFNFLRLASCGLKEFPSSLRAMKKIRFLDLSRNEINGRIPDWVGEIGTNELLQLNISHNFITGLPEFRWNEILFLCMQSNKIQGQFPSSICNSRSLKYLDLSDNRFSGVIPPCFGSNISRLRTSNLENNYFNGSIPNTYKDCGQLEVIILNGNQLEGELPSFLTRCRHLQLLDLGNNRLSGSIPNTFKDCGQLEGIILKGNHLEGGLPSSFSNCRSLKVFDLGNNRLNGTFPDWLGDLPFLKVLDLKLNNFEGSINTSSRRKVSFPSLQVLDLSHNGFVGHLPRKYFQSFNCMKNVVNHEKVEYLNTSGLYYSINITLKGVERTIQQIFVDYTIVDLSNNKFEGDIPDIIGSLASLIMLNLSNNSLTGQIPNSLGNISTIESLDLSCNQLTGEIPQSLATLTFLEFLDLSQNHLVGRIPLGTQFSTFDASFGGNPGLCGFPLPNPCEHKNSPKLEAGEDDDSGFTWNSVMLGSGCGILVGLVMGYLMLSTGRPKWFIAIANAVEQIIDRRQNKRRHIYIGK